MTDPVPSVGRMVHYRAFGTPGQEYPAACRAATVTEVGAWMPDPAVPIVEHVVDDVRYRTVGQRWEPDACALLAAPPSGLFLNVCRHDEGDHAVDDDGRPVRTFQGGTWHWPERVGA